jgi:hypothetical protein
MRAVFDSNILVDYLNGYAQAAEEFHRYSQALISQISWMEVLVGCQGPEEEQVVRDFLSHFSVVALDGAVAEAAVMLRRENRLKLPDAIVMATATTHQALLVTRDAKAFSPDFPSVRIPYQL